MFGYVKPMNEKEADVSDNVYGITHVVGSSADGISQAIENAVSTASKTLKNLEWFEVSETRGHIEGGKVGHYQVVLKLGFRYEAKH